MPRAGGVTDTLIRLKLKLDPSLASRFSDGINLPDSPSGAPSLVLLLIAKPIHTHVARTPYPKW